MHPWLFISNIPYTFQMMGLAFEMHDAVAICKRPGKETASETSLRLDMMYRISTWPSVAEVFHYAFCHAGILTGNTN